MSTVHDNLQNAMTDKAVTWASEKPYFTKEILSVNEACLYMDISKSYLYKLTHTRLLAFSCPAGKKIYFKKEDLDKWMLKNRRPSIDEIKAQAAEYIKTRRR